MNIKAVDSGFAVKTPYAPRHIARFRTMGGKWSDPYWVFPSMSEKMLTDYVDEQWGLGDADTDVLVSQTDARDGQSYWHGYVLASRKSRDYSVQLVESTGCDSPLPSSGGSMKSPHVNAPSTAKFALKIPRAFAIRHGLLADEPALPEVKEPQLNPLSGFTSEQLLDELKVRGIAA